ncbi:MAG: hypothetical protein Fur0041_22900 [Bacteroidia bacterium]
MSADFDFIVVGSGCTGAVAAETLISRGFRVHMIDGGLTDEHYKSIIPEKDFVSIRSNDKEQHRYFLGDDFESLPKDHVSTGAQLTPGRQHIIRETERLLKVVSEDFTPMESLALGGLGAGWGLGSCVFSDQELIKCSLDAEEMRTAYQQAADIIGISGEQDDALQYTSAHIKNVQQALPADRVAQRLLHHYSNKKNRLNQKGFYLGRPALALLSEGRQDRQGNSLRDMDFYDDHGYSAYRPQITIEQLKRNRQFLYSGGWMVTSFDDGENHATVSAINIATNERQQFRAKKVILASGVLGTARIVMRSMPGGKDSRLPLMCNPYTYMPCIILSLMGKKIPDKNFGFAQLSLFHDQQLLHEDVAMASIYSYRSLLLFRLLGETPLNFRDGRKIMQYLLSGLLIAGIHHPETFGTEQFITLKKDDDSPTGDVLHIRYQRGAQKDSSVLRREQLFRKAFRVLGAWPLKTVHPGHGSSIHYAGTLPFSAVEKPFTLNPDGQLHGTNNIYVADGSGFTFLPAKGLTLSLMANAIRVCRKI